MPGFVYIFENEHRTLVSAKATKEEIFLSLERMRLALFANSKTATINCCCFAYDVNQFSGTVKTKGPAIEFLIGKHYLFYNELHADMTFALQCSEWPSQITNWAWREKKWPCESDVKRITNYGCHFVPKSQEGDKMEYS